MLTPSEGIDGRSQPVEGGVHIGGVTPKEAQRRLPLQKWFLTLGKGSYGGGGPNAPKEEVGVKAFLMEFSR